MSNWPFNYIDWDKAADALRQDYATVNLGEEDYLYRS